MRIQRTGTSGFGHGRVKPWSVMDVMSCGTSPALIYEGGVPKALGFKFYLDSIQVRGHSVSFHIFRT